MSRSKQTHHREGGAGIRVPRFRPETRDGDHGIDSDGVPV